MGRRRRGGDRDWAASTSTAATAAAPTTSTKIRIRVGGRTLDRNGRSKRDWARDFLSLLPCRCGCVTSPSAKTAALPRALARGRRSAFAAGDIVYRPGARSVVVATAAALRFRLGERPGREADANARAFSVPGTVSVRIERVRTSTVVGSSVRFTSTWTSVDVTIGQDNPAVRDFLSMLPSTLTVEEFTGREKISYLPRKLRHSGSPGSDPKDGDLIYFVPWGNLGFYYNAEGIGYLDATIHLGTYRASLDQLERLEGRVTVRRVRDERPDL